MSLRPDRQASSACSTAAHAHAPLKETRFGVSPYPAIAVLEKRDNSIEVRGGTNHAEDLDRGPHHHVVLDFKRGERDLSGPLGKAWDLSVPLRDELSEKVKVAGNSRNASVPLEPLSVRSVEHEPLPHWIAGLRDQAPRRMGSVVGHCASAGQKPEASGRRLALTPVFPIDTSKSGQICE
jgi:hypothetical protein